MLVIPPVQTSALFSSCSLWFPCMISTWRYHLFIHWRFQNCYLGFQIYKFHPLAEHLYQTILSHFRWSETHPPTPIPIAVSGFIIYLVSQPRTWKLTWTFGIPFLFTHIQWFSKFNILHPRDSSWFCLILSNHTAFPLIQGFAIDCQEYTWVF